MNKRLGRPPFEIFFISFFIFSLSSLALSQETKRFSSEGASFDYPAEWILEDQSKPDIEQVYLYDKVDDALVQVIVLKKQNNSKTAMTDLKKQVIDPWIEQLVEQYSKNGVALKREAITGKIGDSDVEGVKFSFILDNNMGNGEALWTMLGKKLVLLYFVYSEKSAAKSVQGWNILKKSISAEEKNKVVQK